METLQYLLLHLYIYIYMETLFTFTMYLQDSNINILNKKLLFTLCIFLNNIKKNIIYDIHAC